MTSRNIGFIIINSVAIAFIMDIDNFCVEAFQSEAVTKRTVDTVFETSLPATEEKFTEGIPKGFDLEVVATFTNVKKVITVIFISGILVVWLRFFYCL